MSFLHGDHGTVMNCPSENAINGICASGKYNDCDAPTSTAAGVVRCTPLGPTVYSNEQIVTPVVPGSSWVGDCGVDSIVHGLCVSGMYNDCANGNNHTVVSCQKLVSNPWVSGGEPSWQNQFKDTQRFGDYTGSVASCASGYVASAICNGGKDADDCNGDTANPTRGITTNDFARVKCGKLRQTEIGLIDSLSKG